jgi:undecaprenyl-diphosphatase
MSAYLDSWSMRWHAAKLAERNYCLTINHWCMSNRFWIQVFTWSSRLGDGWIWLALLILLPWLYGSAGRSAAQQMALAAVLGIMLYRWLKRYSKRPRPLHSDARIIASVPPLDRYSFPSGHTLHATSFTLLSLAWFPQLGLVLVPLSLLIAGSRVALGLHYPSDVLIGGLLGAALAFVAQSLGA